MPAEKISTFNTDTNNYFRDGKKEIYIPVLAYPFNI